MFHKEFVTKHVVDVDMLVLAVLLWCVCVRSKAHTGCEYSYLMKNGSIFMKQ